MNVKYVILYKLKNRKNIEDIVNICRRLNIEVIYIPREDSEYVPENVQISRDIYEIVHGLEDNVSFIVLETYGDKYLTEIDLGENICVIVGAEDTGIPEIEINKLPRDRTHVVKIPMGVYGASYNVVTSLIMMLTECLIRTYDEGILD
ncbi:MAG: tRNA (cytidine(34)-2'-O)-methyltransferase [Crenarchaeota archaeon]|nr:tRNA (cytidine(34)-2'-O)-methyltransferase [Thermoproteota archaeon]